VQLRMQQCSDACDMEADLAPLLSPLMTIFLSTGPVISTRLHVTHNT
jgi:hypothetical protein